MLKEKILIVLGVALCLVGCSGSKEEGAPPVFVEMGQVKTQDWQNNVQATGTLYAMRGAPLKSEVAGRVTKIYFTPGAHVRAGDLLVDINPSILEAAFKSAEANQELAHSNFMRAQKLYAQKVISRADYDQSNAAYKSALALQHQAEAQLAQARIRAPYDGTAGINQVSVGDYVSVGDLLVNLEQLDQLRVDFYVPEHLAGAVHAGDKVMLTAHGNTKVPYEGKVSAVDSAIDPNTRMFMVRALIPNKEEKLFPGGFAQVTLYYGPTTPKMVVPQTALVDEVNTHNIYLVDKQHAKEVPVTIGERFGDKVIILSGVKPGDTIITAGLVKVHNGAMVLDPAMMEKKANAGKPTA